MKYFAIVLGVIVTISIFLVAFFEVTKSSVLYNMFFPDKEMFDDRVLVKEGDKGVYVSSGVKLKYPGRYAIFIRISNAEELKKDGFQIMANISGEICLSSVSISKCQKINVDRLNGESYQSTDSFLLLVMNVDDKKYLRAMSEIKLEVESVEAVISSVVFRKLPDW